VSNIFVKDYFHGSISFETQHGKGTTFKIKIPLKTIREQ
jgi:chemotaxis protein histidine kinase CheA